MQLNLTTLQHSAWVGSMGWHNKQPLEYLALIGSEIGEAVAEAPCNAPTSEFGSELMDIVLRVLDFAHMQSVNLPDEFRCLLSQAPIPGALFETMRFSELALLAVTLDTQTDGPGTVLESLALMTVDMAKAMNDCRGLTRPVTFGGHLASLVLRVLRLAHQQRVDIDATIRAKIEKNALKGNKGRLI